MFREWNILLLQKTFKSFPEEDFRKTQVFPEENLVFRDWKSKK